MTHITCTRVIRVTSPSRSGKDSCADSYEVLDELDRLHCARQADPPTKSATFCARHAPRHAAGCTIADAIVRFSASLPVPFPSPLFSLTFPSKPGLLTRPRGFRTALGALMAACSYALVPGGKSLTLRSVWLEPHTSHVHGPVHFAIEARVSASGIPSSTSHC